MTSLQPTVETPMTHLPWPSASQHNYSPSCTVLVPETEADRQEIRSALKAQGVSDRTSFTKRGVNGMLNFPDNVRWQEDGAVELQVSVRDSSPVTVWFWMVEIDGDPVRRYAWWGTERERSESTSWE